MLGHPESEGGEAECPIIFQIRPVARALAALGLQRTSPGRFDNAVVLVGLKAQ
jgi:hypothetical protein